MVLPLHYQLGHPFNKPDLRLCHNHPPLVLFCLFLLNEEEVFDKVVRSIFKKTEDSRPLVPLYPCVKQPQFRAEQRYRDALSVWYVWRKLQIRVANPFVLLV